MRIRLAVAALAVLVASRGRAEVRESWPPQDVTVDPAGSPTASHDFVLEGFGRYDVQYWMALRHGSGSCLVLDDVECTASIRDADGNVVWEDRLPSHLEDSRIGGSLGSFWSGWAGRQPHVLSLALKPTPEFVDCYTRLSIHVRRAAPPSWLLGAACAGLLLTALAALLLRGRARSTVLGTVALSGVGAAWLLPAFVAPSGMANPLFGPLIALITAIPLWIVAVPLSLAAWFIAGLRRRPRALVVPVLIVVICPLIAALPGMVEVHRSLLGWYSYGTAVLVNPSLSLACVVACSTAAVRSGIKAGSESSGGRAQGRDWLWIALIAASLINAALPYWPLD